MKLKVTWKFIIYIVVFILSLAPAVLVNTLVGYGPALIVLLSGIICFIWIAVIRKKLHVEIKSENLSCERGKESPFQVSVENKSIFPVIGLRIVFFVADDEDENTKNEELFLSVSPKSSRNFGFDAGFNHIGAYKAGTKRVEVRDPFGIFVAANKKEESYTLEILPQVVTMNELPVSTKVQIENYRAKIQSPLDGSDYTSVREYSFGDPIKNIHWKLSAHAGTLMTKQMESYSNTGVSIVLDMSIPESDREFRLDEFDAVVESGVAAGHYAARNGLDFDMMFYRRDGSIARVVPSSFRSLGGIVREFRASIPDNERTLLSLLESSSMNSFCQANVVVCTSHVDNALVMSLAGIKQRGHNPMLFLILSDKLTERERENRMSPAKQLQYYNIPCSVISEARELEV